MNYLSVDLHVHTNFSVDGYLDLYTLDKACGKKNINVVAITDHNCVNGALTAERMHLSGKLKTKIIVGEEITTTQGEVIGLFLHKKVPHEMSMYETIMSIKEQGGIVYLNHPFGYSQRSTKLNLASLEHLWDSIDIVEVFNGRNMKQDMNTRALELANIFEKPLGVGTDAHSVWEVGRSFSLMPQWKTPEEFLRACRQIKNWVGRPCPLWYRILFKMRKMTFPRPVPMRTIG